MISIFFLIVFTPVLYLVSIPSLYFVAYARDPLRFLHPHKQAGQESWIDVLRYLNLTKESTIVKDGRKFGLGYVLFASLAIATPVSVWIATSFSVLSSDFLRAAFSLLFQFCAAVAILFAVVIPNCGRSANIWRKHVSNLGAPKRRLGSRALHLIDLKEKKSAGKQSNLQSFTESKNDDKQAQISSSEGIENSSQEADSRV